MHFRLSQKEAWLLEAVIGWSASLLYLAEKVSVSSLLTSAMRTIRLSIQTIQASQTWLVEKSLCLPGRQNVVYRCEIANQAISQCHLRASLKRDKNLWSGWKPWNCWLFTMDLCFCACKQSTLSLDNVFVVTWINKHHTLPWDPRPDVWLERIKLIEIFNWLS